MSLALFLLAQVGPSTMPLPTANIPLPAGRRVSAPRMAPPPCLALTRSDPGAALAAADRELRQAKGAAVADPALCKATALGALDRWSEAADAYQLGRDALPASDHTRRAEFGAGAAIAVEAGQDWARALALYDTAHADAAAAGDLMLGGRISRDRAQALIKLGRRDEAAASLTAARAALPADSATWLISAREAVLRTKLAEAQNYIERAATLAPGDPEIGLQAGIIAMLDHRETAARRSWESVVAMAPDSPAAQSARGYLAQLDLPAPQ